MTKVDTQESAKNFVNSPLFKVVQFLLMLVISIVGSTLLRAETRLAREIGQNEERIEVVEKTVNELENSSIQMGEALKYIREGIDDIKTDIKEIKKNR